MDERHENDEWRTQVDLPGHTVDIAAKTAKRIGTTAAVVWMMWLTQSAQLVVRGHGDLLPKLPPKATRLPAGSLANKRKVRWKMSQDMYAWMSELLRVAGSSVSLCLITAADCSERAGYDLTRSEWPPERSPAPAEELPIGMLG